MCFACAQSEIREGVYVYMHMCVIEMERIFTQ